MKVVLNHIAILVESIESALDKESFPSQIVGELEEFPGEGTRECYVGENSQLGKLLLMQAIGDGPYQRALEKRGPGLHHIALDVENIDDFLVSISNSGWLLHPKSIDFYKNGRSVYLCRPGTPVLMEVQERKIASVSDYFIDKVLFPFEKESLQSSLSCERIQFGKNTELITAEGKKICQFLV